MSDQNLTPLWTQPDWLEEAKTWIQTTLTHQRITRRGPIEQPHIRPWATVLRVPTDAGDIYFKATVAALAHEPALTQALARRRPDCMPQVLGVDPGRGWLLTRDMGVTLRSLVQSPADLWRWHEVLPLFAELQLELAAQTADLLALGTPDRRLAGLPAQFESLLTDTAALQIDQPDGLTAEEYRQLQDLVPTFARMCEALAAYPIPETLQHDDFHDANIFVQEERVIFSDWGECGITHPFFSLLFPPRITAYRLNLADDAPALTHLRDAYLEPWTRLAPRPELLAAWKLAYQVGTVNRALTWHRILSSVPESLRGEDVDAVPGWLQEFLEAQAEMGGEFGA